MPIDATINPGDSGITGWAEAVADAINDLDSLLADGVGAAPQNAARFDEFGTPQHEDGTTYTYPNLLNFGPTTAPPVATAAASKGVDIVAHWYNDFGLDKTALAASEANGWYGWYDWRWNFPTNTGNGTTTLGYDDSRHPIQGFYKGDNANVLDWQCYWMAEAGVNVLSITSGDGGFSSTGWSSPSNQNYWIYQLMNNVPNFRAFQYMLWLKNTGTTTAIEAQNDEVVSAYATYPRGYTISEAGKNYATVFVWNLEAIRGAYDSYSGQANTVAYLKALAVKFQAIGFDGVAVLARDGGFAITNLDPSLLPAGVLLLEAGYETHYGVDSSYGNSYATYAANVSFPTSPLAIPAVSTSGDTQFPHPSTMSLANSTPAAFAKVLSRAVASVLANGQRRIVTIYNVSEWAEAGPGLIPNKQDGFGYLDAIRQLPAINNAIDAGVARRTDRFFPRYAFVTSDSTWTTILTLTVGDYDGGLIDVSWGGVISGAASFFTRRVRSYTTAAGTVTLNTEGTDIARGGAVDIQFALSSHKIEVQARRNTAAGGYNAFGWMDVRVSGGDASGI